MDTTYFDQLQIQQKNYETEVLSNNQRTAQVLASDILNQEGGADLIRYQLDLNDLLGRIGGLLGVNIRETKSGRLEFEEPANKEEMTFNTWGTREIIKVLS